MSDGNVIDIGSARQLLDQERQDRAARCQEKIQAILNEERCRIDVSVIINSSGVFPQAQILAAD